MSKHKDLHLDEMRLHEFLDGALDTDAQHVVEAHITACPSCSARLRELQALFDVLKSLPEESLRRDLSLPVLAGVRPRNSKSVRNKFNLVMQFVALGVTLAFVWTNIRFIAEWIILSPLGIEIVEGVYDFTVVLPEAWSGLNEIFHSFLTSSRMFAKPIITSSLQIDGGGVLLVVFLAWLLANGLLLRTSAIRLRAQR